MPYSKLIPKVKSIRSLDIAKCYAVIAMILGHTLSQFLSKNSLLYSSPSFEIWNFIRGLSAPIFLFASGVIYSKTAFKVSTRKKLMSIILLLFLAYGMHIPFFFGSMQEFLRVDILHVFAVLFTLNLFIFRQKRKNIPLSILAFLISCFVIKHSLETGQIDLPTSITNYFTKDNGSLFILPFSGAIFHTGSLTGLFTGIFKVNKLNLNETNRFILFVSRNSLWYYILHLLMLYGDKNLIGARTYVPYYSLSLYESITLFLIIFTITSLLIYSAKKFKSNLF